MTPLDFARALADLMRPRVISAQRYLDDHRDLEQLGMPIEIVRHALDRPTIETGPLAALDAWNGKGLLALHGARDNGKTHATAVWGLQRLRAGRRTSWVRCPGLLSWEALDAALDRVTRAPAVVLDEVGPGLGGTDGFRKKITSWIQDRGHLPTVLTSNANEAQLEDYLGGRLLSRLRQAGDVRHFPREAGLRKPDLEELDKQGRGAQWQRATWEAWRFGCEPDDHVEAGRVVHGYRVGDALEQARLTIEQLHALAMHFGLAVDVVDARAREIEAEADRVRGEMSCWTPPELETRSKMADIIELADADVSREKRAAKVAEANCGITTIGLGEAPRWAREDRAKLVKLGFRVDALADGFVVKRKLAKDSPKFVGMSPKMPTQPLAWEYAARLCAL